MNSLSKSTVDFRFMKMNIITVVLSGISIVTTLTIVILGSLLSKCNSNSSHDTIMGGKTEVEKDEYDLVIMDGGECNCTTGLRAMSWTILEVVVIGVFDSSCHYDGSQGSCDDHRYFSREETREVD